MTKTAICGIKFRLERFFHHIAYGGQEKGTPFFLSLLLSPLYLLSLFYGLAVNIRVSLFNKGLKESRSLPCKVISVGNITVGGTGKTPVVEYIARQLTERGLKVAILSRGYKGTAHNPVNVVSDGQTIFMEPHQAGDEPYMLAKRLRDVPVIVGADRYVTGSYGVEHFHVDVLVLDDGYQHIKVKRDVNILLVDGERGFGNGHLFPRGPLREPLSNMERADFVLVTKCKKPAQGVGASGFMPDFSKIKAKPLTFCSGYEPLNLQSFWTGNKESVSVITGKKVVTLSGIANPSSFTALIKSLGGNVLHEEAFPDHHAYSPKDLHGVMKKAENLGADMIVTTEKDAVKIEEIDERVRIPFYYLQIGLDLFGDDERFVENILSRCGIRET